MKNKSDNWENNERWAGIIRPYSLEDVLKLRGSVLVEHTLADLGADKLWKILHSDKYITALGALTGNQAIQQVQAGLKAIYVSGWQVAADQNESYQMYPDQSLYPSNSVPILVKRINASLQREDQIAFTEGKNKNFDWFVPIIADAEAGFGGALNAYELMRQMIEAGASAVHFEDQLSTAKKCGHLGGKVLTPADEFIQKLIAARLAADVCGVPTLLIGRTDSYSAKYITSDISKTDQPYLTGKRSSEGYYEIKSGIDLAITRALSYAGYVDMLWFETDKPDLKVAKEFAEAIHKIYPNKLLGYNCSPSFNWSKLDDGEVKEFNEKLGELGYKFQFVTLAGFHSLNSHMFDLSKNFKVSGMAAYREFQKKEFEQVNDGYQAVKHQDFVGVGYYDEIMKIISKNQSSMLSMDDSTEKEQF